MPSASARGSIERALAQSLHEGRIVFVLSGPAGAGKTTLSQRVASVDPRVGLNVSCTTRPARPGERPGSDYHFLEPAEFESLVKQGQMLEWAEVHGHLYGTRASDALAIMATGRDVLLEIDIQGGTAVRSKYPRTVLLFVVGPSFASTKARLVGRGSEDDTEVARRLARAREEIRLSNRYDYLIVNDDVNSAVSSIRSIITAERARMTGPKYRALVADAESANQIAKGDETNA